jgi:predicted AlkP superfamily phosphohydrolase/phosphomutase
MRTILNRIAIAAVCLMCAVVLAACRMHSRVASGEVSSRKMIVLGIDGMDPDLLQEFMDAGKMPHFAALAKQGSFVRLGTSDPPQSPVAWSNLITGMNPGGHAIFDFIHRDPKTMLPYLSTSEVEPSKHTVGLGKWIIPLTSGETRLLRQGKAFWQYLDDRGIQATIFRIPSNFPPVKTKARTFAGMGTPDLLGTYGTFSFYTDDFLMTPGAVDGGHIYPAQVENGMVHAKLYGPYNTLRKDHPQSSLDFTVAIDPVNPVAKISIGGQELVLREGEWSPWVRIEFTLIPVLESVSGICRFYLKQAHSEFQLYVSPVNLDPAHPALPLSTPSDYSSWLAEQVGSFYTQGIAEDTKALSSGVLDDGEYLRQAQIVAAERQRIFDIELPRFRSGLFFFYFSEIDLNSHMFWRAMDPHHPGYRPELGEKYGGAIEGFYVEMDQVLGETMQRVDQDTTLIVLSDHGFAPFYHSFNLNTWLLENGYLALKPGTTPSGDFFSNVDWLHTRAYGLGLNGLYLNLSGREKEGIVHPGTEAEALKKELAAKLLAFRDPSNGAQVITRMDAATDVYSGPYVAQAPDLIVGYMRGYRAGWSTVLGSFSPGVLDDNTEPWSGDHCMDYTQVPGVLLSNRKIAASSPSLIDIAPTILSFFGISKPASMPGSSVFAAPSARSR